MAFEDTGLYCGLHLEGIPAFPKIEKPHALGCFSINEKLEFKDSADGMRYYRKPQNFPLNLNEGLNITKLHRNLNKGMDHLLEYINHHQNELLSKAELPTAKGVQYFDFICYRGVFRLLMNTPYEWCKDWCVLVTKFKGNIYLAEHETEQEECDRLNRTEDLKTILSYGYKFEQFCLTRNPSEEPNTNVPVDELTQFVCMYETKLEGMNLLYGAVIDGVMSNSVCQNVENKDVLNTLKLVELKCSLRPRNERQRRNFLKYKCRQWWCSCFIIGLHDIIVGSRNEEGFIDEINHMDARELSKMGNGHWTPSHCVDFLARFLQMVQHLMRDTDCPETVYEFYYDPTSRVTSYRVHNGKSEYTILPDWYVKMLEQGGAADLTFEL